MAVLCYHTVDPNWESGLAVAPSTFAAHANWLARHRDVVDLETALQLMDRRGRLPRGVSCLTFDDGLDGLYEHAMPILRDLRLPAAVFVVARTLLADDAVDWIDDPPEHRLRTLTREHLQEMMEAGWQVASHSFAHHDLTTLEPYECEEDLATSRTVLEDLFHRRVDHLAYPRGRHDEGVQRATKRAGYGFAWSLPEHREAVGPYSLPRVGMYRHNAVRTLRVKSTRGYLRARTGPLGQSLR
jgi:peptidoglycan/xylan/chitin deacetylase (PgdA/CDA1 family)